MLRTSHIPADFLYQLLALINEDKKDIIEWTPGGNLMIHHPRRLEKELLGKYFRHAKFSSFQRQLHYFGFLKQAGRRRMAACEFIHEKTTTDLESLLYLKRKASTNTRFKKSPLKSTKSKIISPTTKSKIMSPTSDYTNSPQQLNQKFDKIKDCLNHHVPFNINLIEDELYHRCPSPPGSVSSSGGEISEVGQTDDYDLITFQESSFQESRILGKCAKSIYSYAVSYLEKTNQKFNMVDLRDLCNLVAINEDVPQPCDFNQMLSNSNDESCILRKIKHGFDNTELQDLSFLLTDL